MKLLIVVTCGHLGEREKKNPKSSPSLVQRLVIGPITSTTAITQELFDYRNLINGLMCAMHQPDSKHQYLLCLSSFIKKLKKTVSWYISYYLLFPVFFLKRDNSSFFPYGSLHQKKVVEWINQNLIISRTMYSFAWRNLGILISFLQIINTFIMMCFAYSITAY